MRRLPIRLRITLAFAVAMAAMLTAVGALVYVRVGGALLSSVDETLHAQAVEASRNRDEPALVDRDAGGGRALAQLLDARGRILRSTPSDLPRLLPAAEAPAVAHGTALLRSRSLARLPGEWRILAMPTRDRPGVVVVGLSLEPREQTLQRLFRELLIAGPLALLLASLGGYGLAAAALRPVEAMRRRAAAVTARSPARLPVPPARDEISRLAETLNDMLDRLEASIEHERRFVADASHELRTPLALLRTELELALRRPRPAAELQQALRSAAEETERLSRLAEDLLLLARAEQGTLPLRREEVDADDVLSTVARRFAAHAAELGRSVVAEPTDLVLEVDAARVEQALGNLVDNALVHGAGPVELEACAGEDGVELHVADRGPGFTDAFLDRAFDRFSRADDARHRGGAGLGLSIVALVAEAHGGVAAAANRPGGGADVWLTLPGRPARPRPVGMPAGADAGR